MSTAPPTISALPTPPDPNDRSTFNARAYPWSVAQQTLATQANAVAANVYANAQAAETGAATASTKAGEASTSASNAATSASTATTKAGEASNSASSAETSRIEASKLNLGPKAVAPIVNNQGGALLAGATYYDTALARWRVWSGTVWGDGVSVGSGVVAAQINAAASKTAPANADELGITDSAASWGLKKLTFANLKAWISSLGGAGIGNTPSGDIQATNVQAAINELDSEKVSKSGGTISGNLNVTGNVLVTGGGALGYGIGAGGTVTQATSKITSVTLNKVCGKITMHNAALAANGAVRFIVYNTFIGENDEVSVWLVNPVNQAVYDVAVDGLVPGVVAIRLRNNTSTSYSDSVVLGFAVRKGATS